MGQRSRTPDLPVTSTWMNPDSRRSRWQSRSKALALIPRSVLSNSPCQSADDPLSSSLGGWRIGLAVVVWGGSAQEAHLAPNGLGVDLRSPHAFGRERPDAALGVLDEPYLLQVGPRQREPVLDRGGAAVAVRDVSCFRREPRYLDFLFGEFLDGCAAAEGAERLQDGVEELVVSRQARLATSDDPAWGLVATRRIRPYHGRQPSRHRS